MFLLFGGGVNCGCEWLGCVGVCGCGVMCGGVVLGVLDGLGCGWFCGGSEVGGLLVCGGCIMYLLRLFRRIVRFRYFVFIVVFF